MRRQSDRYRLGVLSDLSVTPLIDLAFVLLVVFLISAPFLVGGDSGSVSEGGGEESPLRTALPRAPSIVLEVELGRQCILDGQPVQWSRLPEALGAAGGASGQSVVVRCHPDLAVREVVAVMAVLDAAGAAAVSVETSSPL